MVSFSLDVWTTIVSVATIWLLVKVFVLMKRRWKFQRALKDFPDHPRGIFFIGHAKAYMDGARGMLSDWEGDYENNEKAVQAWITPFSPGVVVYHPDTITAILNTTNPKDWTYRFIYDFLGEGILLAEGKKWARNRQLISPAFHGIILKPYVKVFVNSTKTLVSKWNTISKGNACSMDVSLDIGLCALDSLLHCVMGVDEDVQNGAEHTYIESAELLAKDLLYRFYNLPYHSDLVFALSPRGFQNRKALRIAHDYSSKVIAERKLAINEGRVESVPGKFMPFLDTLLKAKDDKGQGLTDLEIRNEVDTFMFGGHDTTGSALSWAIYNLSAHPDMQERCRKEVDEVLGDGVDFVEWDDLSKFDYLVMFIKESLRMYPPIPVVVRHLDNEVELPDGRVIPEGAAGYCNINGVHRNPNVWPDPTVFNPERFTRENSIGRPHNAFIPFATGPRHCIGQVFAMIELKTVLAVLLRNFRFEFDACAKPVQRINYVTLKSTTGIHVIVAPRDTKDNQPPPKT